GGAGGAAKPVTKGSDRRRIAGEEALEVLAARGGPGKRVGVKGIRDRARRRIHGKAVEGDARAQPTGAADVSEVGGKPVGAVHHGVHADGRAQPESLRDARGGTEMRGGDGLP